MRPVRITRVGRAYRWPWGMTWEPWWPVFPRGCDPHPFVMVMERQ